MRSVVNELECLRHDGGDFYFFFLPFFPFFPFFPFLSFPSSSPPFRNLALFFPSGVLANQA